MKGAPSDPVELSDVDGALARVADERYRQGRSGTAACRVAPRTCFNPHAVFYELNQSKYGAQLSAEISDWLQAIAIAKSELDIPPAPERSNWKTQLQQVEFNANRLMDEYAAFKDIMDIETSVPGSQNMQ